MQRLRVTKLSKKSRLNGSGGELEATNCFQRQLITKYLRQTLVFMRNRALRVVLNIHFSSI